MTFDAISDFRAVFDALPGPDEEAMRLARLRQAELTKPPGALGRLEALAVWYAGWRGRPVPSLDRVQIVVFAGNHGVVGRGVSAYPADVTAQMVANFTAGGAAINQLARAAGAVLDVHPLNLDRPTGDFTAGPAMDKEALLSALSTGWNAVDPQADLLVPGEMGIANTTSAAALAAALFGGRASDWTGRGTGIGDAMLARKIAVVGEGLARHRDAGAVPLDALRRLGGHEIAAIVGALVRARTLRIPVLLDGFIVCVAAGVLHRIGREALLHAEAAHLSDEAGHQRVLTAIGKTPLLSLGLRLGEASGAALAVPILRAAVEMHGGMATFAEAGVAQT